MKFKELAWGAFVLKNSSRSDYTYQSLGTDKEFLGRLQTNPSLDDFERLRSFLVHYGVPWAPKNLAEQYLPLWPKLKPHIQRLSSESLVGSDLNSTEIQDEITEAYLCINRAWGGDTVVAKVLHFFNVSLFVMWDDAIFVKYRQGKLWAAAYLEFLKAMQKEAIEVVADFKALSLAGNTRIDEYLSKQLGYQECRPLTKFLDDYNWITITRGWPSTVPNWLMSLFI